MYSMTWPPLALVSPISRTGGPPIDSRRGDSASDEVADQAIDQGRLLVDEPVRAVGDATDREVRNVARQPVEVAGQERPVALAPQDEGGYPDRRVAGELADRRRGPTPVMAHQDQAAVAERLGERPQVLDQVPDRVLLHGRRLGREVVAAHVERDRLVVALELGELGLPRVPELGETVGEHDQLPLPRGRVVQAHAVDIRVAVLGHQLIRFSRPAHSLLRRTNFCTLPVEVLGRSPNSTAAGALKWARCCLQNSMISGSVAVRPGLSVTKALRRSPHLSAGTATTAHSRTAGCLTTVCSTSIVEMFSPPEMMMSFFRSRSSM